MGNQRPPGGDGPTEDPRFEQRNAGGAPPAREPAPERWVDPARTQAYRPQRRSIVDRLKEPSREPDSGPGEPPRPAQPPPHPNAETRPPPQPAEPAWHLRRRQVRSVRRGSGGLRLVAILAGVVVFGLAAGAAAAWFSGWRPGFLAAGASEERPPAATEASTPGEKPGEKPPPDKPPGETKPNETAPPSTELARSCFTTRTELKAGTPACGLALDAEGALSFQGGKVTDRLAAGAGPARRALLYPFSRSGRFVFLRACETASGGRCASHSLLDTKEKRLIAIRGDAGDLHWVAFSPKEEVGLLGYRDGTADSVAAVATADGKVLLAAAIRSRRNQYAMVRERSLRWPDENSFSIEVKLCTFERTGRNAKCEQDEKIRFRRRLVKLAR
jgi:hypothetical protein